MTLSPLMSLLSLPFLLEPASPLHELQEVLHLPHEQVGPLTSNLRQLGWVCRALKPGQARCASLRVASKSLLRSPSSLVQLRFFLSHILIQCKGLCSASAHGHQEEKRGGWPTGPWRWRHGYWIWQDGQSEGDVSQIQRCNYFSGDELKVKWIFFTTFLSLGLSFFAKVKVLLSHEIVRTSYGWAM